MKPSTPAPVRCAVCESCLRPLYVPWQQHAIGCAVRSELQRRELSTTPAPSATTRAA